MFDDSDDGSLLGDYPRSPPLPPLQAHPPRVLDSNSYESGSDKAVRSDLRTMMRYRDVVLQFLFVSECRLCCWAFDHRLVQ